LNLAFYNIVQFSRNQGAETLRLPGRAEIQIACEEGEEAVTALAENECQPG
jgi:hypothetical protein